MSDDLCLKFRQAVNGDFIDYFNDWINKVISESEKTGLINTNEFLINLSLASKSIVRLFVFKSLITCCWWR